MVLLYKDPKGEAMTENTFTHRSGMSMSVKDNVLQLSNYPTRSKTGNQDQDTHVHAETSPSS